MAYTSLVQSIGNAHMYFQFKIICLTTAKSPYSSVTGDVPHTKIWCSRKIPNFQYEF